MKNKTPLLIIAAILLLSCLYKTNTSDFLFLNKEQLKSLGITLSDKGVFYKNYNPNWKLDHERYPYLGFQSNKIYLKTIQYEEGDTLNVNNKYDKIFLKMETTHYDFYPILIGNPKGDMSFDNSVKLTQNQKLLPVAICMSETKFSNRKDTLIVWFKVTESIKKALPQDIKIDNYLQEPIIANK
jgi:hypothetical protein